MGLSDYVDIDNLNINFEPIAIGVTTAINAAQYKKTDKEKIAGLIKEKDPEVSITKVEEFAKARNKFGWIPRPGDTISHIIGMAGDAPDKQIEYMEKADKGRTLAQYTIYYLTDDSSVLPEDLTSLEKRIINGIADNIVPELGKIFEDEDTANIEVFAPSSGYNPDYTGEYIISQEDIDSLIPDQFIEKVRARWAKINWDQNKSRSDVLKLVEQPVEVPNLGPVGRFDSDGIYYPFFTVDNPDLDVPVKPEPMSDEDFDKYELVFSGYIPADKKHYYSYDFAGNTYLTIYSNIFDKVDRIIDNGKLNGGSHVWILTSYCTPDGSLDNVFVDAMRYPNIVKKILASSLYVLSQEEARDIFSRMYNGRIYYNIDLTNTGFLDNFTFEDKVEFERSCNYIFQILDQDAMSNTRLRFLEYSDPFNFILVSDINVNRSLVYHAQEIMNGLTFYVKGDEISKTFNGKGYRYNAQ